MGESGKSLGMVEFLMCEAGRNQSALIIALSTAKTASPIPWFAPEVMPSASVSPDHRRWTVTRVTLSRQLEAWRRQGWCRLEIVSVVTVTPSAIGCCECIVPL